MAVTIDYVGALHLHPGDRIAVEEGAIVYFGTYVGNSQHQVDVLYEKVPFWAAKTNIRMSHSLQNLTGIYPILRARGL